MILLESVV